MCLFFRKCLIIIFFSIFAGTVAMCPKCATCSKGSIASHAERDWSSQGIMKPKIVFFGEHLDGDFEKKIEKDREEVDFLVVIGTSLQVAPASDIIK